MGAVSLGIWKGLYRRNLCRREEGLLGLLQWAWTILVISEFLHWPMLCWPNHGNYHILPLVLLGMAAYACSGGAQRAARAGGLLLWFVMIMLGGVLLLSLREVNWNNMMPAWELAGSHLITVLLIPAMGMCLGETEKRIRIPAAALCTAVITTGVLTLTGVQGPEAPFYEMSRSISRGGGMERLESIAAAGMLIGYYVLASYLIAAAAACGKQKAGSSAKVWITAAAAGTAFAAGIRLESRWLGLGTALLWVVIPAAKKVCRSDK